MKILWLTPIFPYPPFSGGQTRAYNLLKNLAKKNEVTLFSFWRPNRLQGPITEVEKFCVKVKVFKGRPIWTIRNVLLAGLSHLPFTVTHFYGDQLVRMALKKELKTQKYDLVHFESFYTTPYLRSDFGIPTVLGNENVEYLIYQRFVQQKIFPLKWLFSYDIWKMKQYEQTAWKKATLNLAVSKIDAKEVEKATGRKCKVIPNGVDVSHFEQFKPERKFDQPVLLFVGDFKYFTNQDTLSFLVKDIWPKVKKEIANVKLWLVGKNPNPMVKNLASQDVIVDSSIDDIRQAYTGADLLVAPIRMASGTNIKILESMAAGLPVVTTSIGIEGIKAKKNEVVIVADDKDQFADQVIKLLGSKAQRQKLSKSAREVVKRFYDWPEISKKLEKVYQELINGQKS